LPLLKDGDLNIGGFYETLNLIRCEFDFDKLHSITKVITENLNKVIDINFYPTIKTKRSNLKHRPIGIGVQGLADTFILMDYEFEGFEAKTLNKQIFETIYHAALEKSMELSRDRRENFKYILEQYNNGNWNFTDNSDDICTSYNIYNITCSSSSVVELEDKKIEKLLNELKPIRYEIHNNYKSDKYYGSYSSFLNSPAQQGLLQFDLWNVLPSDRYNWSELKNQITLFGLRNSLLLAPMPTASTSQILGNNECFEPITSNIYTRRTLAGEFIIANKFLLNELISMGIWNEDIKDNIIRNKGSIQYIDSIPEFIKNKYKIVWEIKMRNLIDMSRDRGAFICQSQSLNLWMEDPDSKSLTNMHFYSWNQGLKTGIYYLRRKAKHQPQQFTIQPDKIKTNNSNNEPCEMCSS